jgi:hypothetical protein
VRHLGCFEEEFANHYSNPYRTFFLSIMGFTRIGLLFVQLRILVFDSEGLLRSFDNPRFRHPPTGVIIGYPNLATHTAIFANKFGCTHEILVVFQHHVEK